MKDETKECREEVLACESQGWLSMLVLVCVFGLVGTDASPTMDSAMSCGATDSIGVQYCIEDASTGMSGTETAIPMPVRLLTAGRKNAMNLL